MNRTTALLLAMAALLAHTLAIHLDVAGHFAQPYEVAHRAYHLARNLVREGSLAWNAGAEGSWRGGLDAYPSPLWVLVSAVAERLYLPVNLFTQCVGLAAALVAIVFSVHYEKDRIAGVIPALLLVTSGGFAAPAASGTEAPLVGLLLVLSFVAFQERRRILFPAALSLLVLARPEGVLIATAFLALAVGDRRRAGPDDPARATALWIFVPAGLTSAALLVIGDGHGRSLYGAMIAAIPTADGERIAAGLGYALDFALTASVPVLLLFPLGCLFAGRLSSVGRRSLGLGLLWVALVVLEGGGPPPFTLALAPALPLLAIAVQQGIVGALDTLVPALERLAWTALLGCTLLGAFASKFPGDLGPIRLRGLHERWLETSAAPASFGLSALRGRSSLGAEIRHVGELRDLAGFLREYVDPRYSILTPWPGAIGYLSQMNVLDMFGRITTPDGRRPLPPWPPQRVDLVAAFEQGADFILLGQLDLREVPEGSGELSVEDELYSYDLDPDDPERLARLGRALELYEVVTIPVRGEGERSPPRPFHLLRRRDLGLAPELTLRLEGDILQVDAGAARVGADRPGPGHPQLVRLEVLVLDAAGERWFLAPDGSLVEDQQVFARTGLRLEVGDERPVRLYTGPLGQAPSGSRLVEVRARLVNPIMPKSHRFAALGEAAVLSL